MLKDFDEHDVWVEFLEFSNLLRNAAEDMLAFDDDYLTPWFLVTGGMSKLVTAHTERVDAGETDSVREDEVNYSYPSAVQVEDVAYAKVLSLTVKFYAIEEALRAKSFDDYDRGCRLVLAGLSAFVNTYNTRAMDGKIVLGGGN